MPVLSSKYRRQMGGWINQCVFIFSDDARPCQMAGRIIAGCVLPDDGRLLLLCSVGTPKEMMQPCLVYLDAISIVWHICACGHPTSGTKKTSRCCCCCCCFSARAAGQRLE